MGSERKATMVSGRLTKELVERMDYVVRNIDSNTIVNRSAALRDALEAWLVVKEDRLRELGVLGGKKKG